MGRMGVVCKVRDLSFVYEVRGIDCVGSVSDKFEGFAVESVAVWHIEQFEAVERGRKVDTVSDEVDYP
jgi:hypothetical protein